MTAFHRACLLVLVANAAHASPIEPLWEVKEACGRLSLTPAGTDFVALRKGKLLTLERATGKRRSEVKLPKLPRSTGPQVGWADHHRIDAVLGDVLVVHTGHAFVGLDAKMRKLLWQREQEGGGLPTLSPVDGDLLHLIAEGGRNRIPVTVERLDPKTGTARWRTPLKAAGQLAHHIVDGTRTYVMTIPDFIGNKIIATAVDNATGKQLWSIEIVTKQPKGDTILAPYAHVVASNGRLVAALPDDGIHIFDGATGKVRRVASPRIAISTSNPRIAVSGDIAFVGIGAGAGADHVVAIDLMKGTMLWKAPVADASIAGAPKGVVYVVDADSILRALDAAKGGELATWGVAGSELVFANRDVAPMFVGCSEGKRLLALDPSGTPRAEATTLVTGKLTCRNCKRRGPLVNVGARIGALRAVTNARGQFAVAAKGRGSVHLYFDLPEVEEPTAWTTTGRIVTIGKKQLDLGSITTALSGPDM